MTTGIFVDFFPEFSHDNFAFWYFLGEGRLDTDHGKNQIILIF